MPAYASIEHILKETVYRIWFSSSNLQPSKYYIDPSISLGYTL